MEVKRGRTLQQVIDYCRQVLEADITKKVYYGLYPRSRTVLSGYSHDLEMKTCLQQGIEKEKHSNLSLQKAVARYARSVGFMYLSRLAALRVMEVRGLIKGITLINVREKKLEEPEFTSTLPGHFKQQLLQIFQELNQEMNFFAVTDEYELLFPEVKTCFHLLKLLQEIPEEEWRRDDIMGWIYQYYNIRTRLEYVRKRSMILKPEDILLLSQFYAPRLVVEALIDNTLGRLWLEMHPDSEIRNFCTHITCCNFERNTKSVRDIKVIDPVCGSGHFLIYAFDVLYRMYSEEEPDTPPHEIVTSILENNLFGIDIDLHAVQLAAFSLYLKAKTYDEPVKLKRMNLVCAHTYPVDEKARSQFLQQFSDRDLQESFDQLFEALDNIYVVGSLLKVRPLFEQVVNRKISEHTLEVILEALREFEWQTLAGTLCAGGEKPAGLLSLLSQKYDVVLVNPPRGSIPLETRAYTRVHYPHTYKDYYRSFMEQAADLCGRKSMIGTLVTSSLLYRSPFKSICQRIFKRNSNQGVHPVVTPISDSKGIRKGRLFIYQKDGSGLTFFCP